MNTFFSGFIDDRHVQVGYIHVHIVFTVESGGFYTGNSGTFRFIQNIAGWTARLEIIFLTENKKPYQWRPKGIDYKVLHTFKGLFKNVDIGPLYWQKGVFKSLLGKYTDVITTGDTYCLSSWFFFIVTNY